MLLLFCLWLTDFVYFGFVQCLPVKPTADEKENNKLANLKAQEPIKLMHKVFPCTRYVAMTTQVEAQNQEGRL